MHPATNNVARPKPFSLTWTCSLVVGQHLPHPDLLPTPISEPVRIPIPSRRPTKRSLPPTYANANSRSCPSRRSRSSPNSHLLIRRSGHFDLELKVERALSDGGVAPD